MLHFAPHRRAVVTALCGLGAGLILRRPALAASVTTGGLPIGRPLHALALHATPAYPPGFSHFAYARPDAPKGGEMRIGAMGSFDSLNPFILRGSPAAGSAAIYDTLTTDSLDEPFTQYGLLAETMEIGPEGAWIEYQLRPQARFHDGRPVTADDAAFSFELLKSKGAPQYRSYYADVEKAEVRAGNRLRFLFKTTDNPELPLIIGQLPVLPRHVWAGRDFETPSLDLPLGSGAYRIGKIDQGRSITLERVADYWGAQLGVNVGQNNFDRLRFDYYRDDTAMMEAFKAGELDIRLEPTAATWAKGYDFPAVTQGKVIKEEIADHQPKGMQGFLFNLRRGKFADRRVRQALGLAFDFEWSNRTFFYGSYKRSESYFANSELAASGLPEGAERALLDQFRAELPPELFTTPFKAPVSDGSGQDRQMLRTARDLLIEAGCRLDNGRLHDPQGQPFTIEVLLDEPRMEKILAPYGQNLKRLGIDLTVRTIDGAQYINRRNSFDFDVISEIIPQTLSPGNEQRDFWSSAAADEPGSQNYMGIKNPVIDRLIAAVIKADSRPALIAACRALDRVLLWHYYCVPQWYLPIHRVAHWDRFGRPPEPPLRELGLTTLWWIDAAKDQALGRKS